MSDSTTVTVLAVVAGVSIVVAAGATTVACFLWHRFAPYKSPRLHNCEDGTEAGRGLEEGLVGSRRAPSGGERPGQRQGGGGDRYGLRHGGGGGERGGQRQGEGGERAGQRAQQQAQREREPGPQQPQRHPASPPVHKQRQLSSRQKQLLLQHEQEMEQQEQMEQSVRGKEEGRGVEQAQGDSFEEEEDDIGGSGSRPSGAEDDEQQVLRERTASGSSPEGSGQADGVPGGMGMGRAAGSGRGEEGVGAGSGTPQEDLVGPSGFDIQTVVQFSLEELREASDNFSVVNRLGEGSYGRVYKAQLRSGELVAVKRAKPDRKQDLAKFRKEVELLSRVSHKHLVRLAGYCKEGGEQLLVYEYIAGGNLSQNLNQAWRAKQRSNALSWTERLMVAAGVARALSYLHEEINTPFIHRDVKASNILIDSKVVAKLADFGTTKPMAAEDVRKLSNTIQGTAGYCDLDYLKSGIPSKRIDVYSFGIVLMELVTGEGPHRIVKPYRYFVEDKYKRHGLEALVDSSMGQYPAQEVQHILDLAFRCTDLTDPASRPSMGRVVAEIEAVLEPERRFSGPLIPIHPLAPSAFGATGAADTARGGGAMPAVGSGGAQTEGVGFSGTERGDGGGNTGAHAGALPSRLEPGGGQGRGAAAGGVGLGIGGGTPEHQYQGGGSGGDSLVLGAGTSDQPGSFDETGVYTFGDVSPA